MDVKLFLKQFLTKSTEYTGTINTKLKISQNPEKTTYWIRDTYGCGVKTIFKQPHRITIFESSLLYCILKGKFPFDYAGYHKCIAGARFIDNIQSITLLEPSKEIVETVTIGEE